MKEQKYDWKEDTSFEPIHIFECGQCFRWNRQEDGSYIGIVKNNILRVEKKDKKILFTSIGEENIEEVCKEYFDLDRNYEELKQTLSSIDPYMKKSIEYGKGIRILNQDLWETIISFIISANNNIPRIKGIIERISKAYGSEMIWEDKVYYTFPTPEQLGKAKIEDLRSLGLGFRDKRVYETTQMVLNKEIDIEALKKEKDVNQIKQILLQFPGVGEKVADCIMLFSLKQFSVFPIDVWVRRVMNELYLKEEDETKVNKDKIRMLAKEKYGDLAGLAQQYLFYWKREA